MNQEPGKEIKWIGSKLQSFIAKIKEEKQEHAKRRRRAQYSQTKWLESVMH